MAYTTKAKIQNYLMITIDDSFDDQITSWISAVTEFINNYCGTAFETESATYKLYDGDGTKEILTDDFTAITKIEVLDEDGNVDYTLDSTDYYYLYPANKTRKNRIVINSLNAPIAIFLKGNQNVKVTGSFSFSATIPADIELAATKLVAGIIGEKNIDIAGEIKSETLGEYSVTLQDVKKMANHLGIFEILDRYRNIQV